MSSPVDVVVIGAGIAGLGAARAATDAGALVTVLEAGDGPGGRMATRRFAGSVVDHGAQFFTTRSPEFSALVDAAVADGAVVAWCDGFDDPPDGYPRWRGREAMTDLCRWMARDLDVRYGQRVTDLRDHLAGAHVLTAPVPDSLALLSFSDLLPAPARTIELAGISYKPTLAVVLAVAEAPPMPHHGGMQFTDHPELAFVTDNRAKGIAADPVLTVHLSNARSGELWDASDADIVAVALDLLAGVAGPVDVLESSVTRWRHAGPVDVVDDRYVSWGSAPVVALAGEAFGGPKVEGAYLSGAAAGSAVVGV